MRKLLLVALALVALASCSDCGTNRDYEDKAFKQWLEAQGLVNVVATSTYVYRNVTDKWMVKAEYHQPVEDCPWLHYGATKQKQ